MNSPLQYLKSLDSKGIRLDLDPIRRVLAGLGHPERRYQAVLVAGTNGKGSISAMAASVLRETGLNVGLYTSPHLIDFRERIRVNGRMISRPDLYSLINEVRLNSKEDLTYFEFLTVLAFLYFCRRKVDIAVLEIGMGGRLDATNVVDPLVSVISNISLEHSEFLGNTLESITREKAGIIRQNGTCVTAAQNAIVIRTLEGICRERQAGLYRVGKDIRFRNLKNGGFFYSGPKWRFSRIVPPLIGAHQVRNTATALAALEILSAKGIPIESRAVLEGLAKTRWEGRLETILERPRVVVDGAHNPAGAAALADALENCFSYRRLILVFGALRGKDFGAMLKRLGTLTDRIILTGIRTERALKPADLSCSAGRYFNRIEVAANAEAALNAALSQAGPSDLICITGSLYLVGEVKKMISRMRSDN